MKLRRIGNSLGTTFGREVLRQAGLSGNEELEVTATPGEIRLRRAGGRLVLEITRPEANALAAGNFDSKAGESALAKVRKMLAAK